MTAVLEVLTGDLAGRSYAIDELPFTIGRKETCSLVLPKKFVSRIHAEILEKADGLLLRSLSEKNPVVARGAETREHGLADGDEFEIGDIRFRFRAAGDGATRAAREAERVASGSGDEPSTQRFRTESAAPDPDEDTAIARAPLAESAPPRGLVSDVAPPVAEAPPPPSPALRGREDSSGDALPLRGREDSIQDGIRERET
ncbi:FHA domain-containing protein, partial [bacterium]|nr:FHA domain-containing protein [bacterium]